MIKIANNPQVYAGTEKSAGGGRGVRLGWGGGMGRKGTQL